MELIARIAPTCPATLLGDPGRFRQILLNLVGNAVKFTDQGEVCVSIEAITLGRDEVLLRCAINDTGIGIDAEAQKRIFDSFSQGDNSTSRLYGGTGLGLAIVRQLVALMGGQASVASRPGQGASFRFSLRLRRPAQIPPSSERHLAGGGEVLIWDEHRGTRELLAAELTRLGLAPVPVASTSALRQFTAEPAAKSPFRFALINISLLEENPAALAELRRLPLFTATRVILLVPPSLPQEAGRSHGRPTGDGVLFKPIRLSLLPQVLHGVEQEQAALPTADNALVPALQAEPPQDARRPWKILVAEDNPTSQRLIGLILEPCYRVDMVDNGQDVLARTGSGRYDLILMDCQMPGMDGFAATRALRERNDPTPIVALTAHAQKEDAERCLAQGMNDYLSKPFKQQQLLDLVAKWLPGK